LLSNPLYAPNLSLSFLLIFDRAMAKLPTHEEIDATTVTFETYFSALGKVAHEWNHMQEELGKLFCEVAGLDQSMGMTIWHALRSDLAQRQMLKAAIEYKGSLEDWADKFPKAEGAIVELVEEINKFSNRRNAAIHAPCSVIVGEDELEIFAVSFSGNPNAKKLRDKDILVEFSWYERTAETYRRYIRDLEFALSDSRVPWPDKTVLPTQGQKT
jgi:hypothetical protein